MTQPSPWPNWAMWQHSQTGNRLAYGLPFAGTVDEDTFFGDLPALQSMIASTKM